MISKEMQWISKASSTASANKGSKIVGNQRLSLEGKQSKKRHWMTLKFYSWWGKGQLEKFTESFISNRRKYMP